MQTVCILGEGAWGTAVATLLAHNGFTVKLWCYQKEVMRSIQTTRFNEQYLPHIPLPAAIVPTDDFKEAVRDVEWIFEAIPVRFLRNLMSQYRSCLDPEQRWVVLSKGIEQETLLFPSQIIDDVLNVNAHKVILVGPSYAQDLAEKQITAFTIASSDCALGMQMQNMVANDYCRPYVIADLMGAQVGAALKNVIALAIGMLDGAGFADNTKAFILTCGLRDMVTCAQALGGKEKTIYGLAGVGDLVLTAMGAQSKNRALGKRLGSGQSLETIFEHNDVVPEGIITATSIYHLMKQKNLDLPICRGVYEVITKQKTIDDVVNELMKRPLEQE